MVRLPEPHQGEDKKRYAGSPPCPDCRLCPECKLMAHDNGKLHASSCSQWRFCQEPDGDPDKIERAPEEED